MKKISESTDEWSFNSDPVQDAIKGMLVSIFLGFLVLSFLKILLDEYIQRFLSVLF